MAGKTLSTTSTISDQFQTYFSKQLLNQITPNLALERFAQKANLPANEGSKAIRFFRLTEPATTDIASITEGTAIASGAYRQLQLEYVEKTLTQVGQTIGISDILSATALFNHLEQASMVNAQDMALKMEEDIRTELGANTANKNYIYAGNATDWAGSNGNAISAADLLDARTALKIDKATPVERGYMVAVAGPQVCRDLMNDSDIWIPAKQYSDVEDLYTGEVGRLYGVRVIETTEPFISDSTGSQYTHDAAGDTYSTFVFGNQTFGVPNLNSQSPFSPRMYIASGADKADPAAQMTTVAFKAFYGAKLLQPKHLCEVYSGTGYSA